MVSPWFVFCLRSGSSLLSCRTFSSKVLLFSLSLSLCVDWLMLKIFPIVPGYNFLFIYSYQWVWVFLIKSFFQKRIHDERSFWWNFVLDMFYLSFKGYLQFILINKSWISCFFNFFCILVENLNGPEALYVNSDCRNTF